ncbi:MAG: transglycosylase SLT domain-containing protein [Candidatus Melainabacteria bacterium]|nr:MAG: transglycosylase SLT domain-containing protein [Candidatus Melainabacteria bacterium]
MYQFESNEATNRPVDNQANLNATMLNDAYFNRVMQPNFAQPNTFMPANNGYRAMEYVPPQVMRQLNMGYPDFSAFYINPMQQQQNYFRQMQMREMMMQARFNSNQNFNPNHCQCPHFDNRFMPRWQPREINPMERPHWRQDMTRRDYPEQNFEQPHRRRRDLDPGRDNRDFPRQRNAVLPPNTDTPTNGELRPQDVKRRDGNQPIPQNERRALMILALKTAGVEPSEANIRGLNTIIEKESGWKPNIVNNWDSNAKKGTPSKGLMQTIGPTFDAYKLAGYDDILNPLHNMIAGIRYAQKRYGALLNVPGLKSMAAGGPYKGY